MIYVLSVKAVSKCKYTEKISIFARYCARNETYSSRMHIIELKQKKIWNFQQSMIRPLRRTNGMPIGLNINSFIQNPMRENLTR